MQVGSVGKSLAQLMIVTLLCATSLRETKAQNSYGGPATGPMQAYYTSDNSPSGRDRHQGAQSVYIDAYGEQAVVPANYYPGGGYPSGCQEGCPPGGMGTYPPFDDGSMGSYGMDSVGMDQCGPHYFDFRAELVMLSRDASSFGQDIAFTSLNIAGVGGPDVRLSSGQLDSSDTPGFRLLGRYDIGPLSVIEFGYMGLFEETSAQFVDPNPPSANIGNLFSLFSNFGLNPPAVAVAPGPMPETERSIIHSISLDTELHSAEISYRRYWVGFSPRVSGTLLAGARYTRLREDFLFSTVGEQSLDYGVQAENDLVGFQCGADMWICLRQGLRLGTEGKIGLYNNRQKLNSTINSTSPTAPVLNEAFEDNEITFLSEFSVDLVADVHPCVSIRAGYEVLMLNSLVLAGENFNTASPYGLVGQAPRVPFVTNDSKVTFHGFHAGIEYVW